MRQPRGFDVVEDGDDETRRFVREDFRRIWRGGGGGGEQNNKSETMEKNNPDEMEESRNNNSASSSRRSSMDLAFRNLRMTPPPLTTMSTTTAPLSSMTQHQYSHQSTPNLTTAHNQSSSSLSPVKAKTATMTSQSRPTTPTPGENERDEELGSRSLYSFYVVLKAIQGGDECSFRAYDDFCLDVVRGEQQQR